MVHERVLNAQRAVNSATLVTLTVLGGPFVITSLVMASGILPVPHALLVAMAGAAGFVAALPAIVFGRSRRRFVSLAVVAIVLTVIAPSLVFLHFQRRGLEYAKAYGSRWAEAAAHSRAAQGGTWPPSLRSVPAKLAPGVDLPKPYIAECQANVCEKIAGYFLHYEVTDAKPHLMLGRRDIAFEWSWSAGKWVEAR
jgi:hypothetical protein